MTTVSVSRGRDCPRGGGSRIDQTMAISTAAMTSRRIQKSSGVWSDQSRLRNRLRDPRYGLSARPRIRRRSLADQAAMPVDTSQPYKATRRIPTSRRDATANGSFHSTSGDGSASTIRHSWLGSRLDLGGAGRYASKVPSVRRLSRHATRLTARCLLIALSAVTLHGSHFSVRAVFPVFHSEAAHQLDAAPIRPEARRGEICLACQLVRTPCGPASLEASALAPIESGSVLHAFDRSIATCLSPAPTPARAPPSFA
jgi:hypothetical protein